MGGEPIVIFHSKGAVSALDKQQISLSREDGSTGVFNRKLDGQVLTFSTTDTTFVDAQTASVWDITGKAISGPLKDKKLTPGVQGDYFTFVWLVFKPETEIYTESTSSANVRQFLRISLASGDNGLWMTQ